SLLYLMGGVDPYEVLVAYAVTVVTAFFLGSLSILVSTVVRRPRTAIILAYVLSLTWFAMPWIVELLAMLWPVAMGWTVPALDWAFPMIHVEPPDWYTPGALVAKALWMVGLQVAYGVGFVALAARLLRPLSRAQEAKQRWEIR